MDLIIAALLGFLLVCLFLLFRSSDSPKRSNLPLPPGPPAWRFIIDILTTRRDYLRLQKYKAYGDLVFTQVSKNAAVVLLNTYEAAHEAFVGQAEIFSGRPEIPYMDLITRKSGIIFIDGPAWQEHRRFTIRALRNFGLGRSGAETIVAEECASMKERLEALGPEEGVDCRKMFTAAINNVIARLTFGERCGTDDPNFTQFLSILDKAIAPSVFDILPIVFPFILRFSSLMWIYNKVSDTLINADKMNDYVRQKIVAHEKVLKEDGGPSHQEATDLCDAYLLERDRQEESNPKKHTFTDWQLIRNMIELFLAGTETTATTLTWATLLLSLNPHVQKRAQDEIQEEIGDRPPQMTDRLRLPYLCALMDEVLRYSSMVAGNLGHRNIEDTELLGFFIPANSMILTNLYGIHHDPALWEKPEDFYPEHFLTPEGAYKPSKYLIPFSIGKRACLGESLARMELFMALATVLQNFEVTPQDPGADIEAILKGIVGTFRCPLPHNILFSKRPDC